MSRSRAVQVPQDEEEEEEFEGFGEITYGPVPLSKEEELAIRPRISSKKRVSRDDSDLWSTRAEVGEGRAPLTKSEAMNIIVRYWGDPIVVLGKGLLPKDEDGQVIDPDSWPAKLKRELAALALAVDSEVAEQFLAEAIENMNARIERGGRRVRAEDSCITDKCVRAARLAARDAGYFRRGGVSRLWERY